MENEIERWLEDLELKKYSSAFSKNEVYFQDLSELTEDDLKEMGLPIGPRRRALKSISALKTATSTEAAIKDGDNEKPNVSPVAERRQLTVMFCDLVGSTELSQQLDPEDLRDIMRRYQDAVAGAVTRYGGHIAKYLGDGVLVYFGWPQAYEDQAERAVRASLDAVTAVNRLQIANGEFLQARVGISTGEVVIGDLVGESGRDEEAVTGETPNLAARLQSAAEPGQVIFENATKLLIGGTFVLEPLVPQRLKGFRETVKAWRVVGEEKVESRFDAAHGSSLLELVGRDAELQLLLDRWETAKSGEGQVVMVAGEAGIGKSRLSQALRDAVSREPHTRLRYQCSPHHMNSALYPTTQQLQHAAGINRDDDGDFRLDKLLELLNDEVEGSSDAALLANLLSIPFEERLGPIEASPAQIKQQTLNAICDQLLRLSDNSPVLFLFEDAHWIDPTSLELLELSISRIQNSPVLIVITHRPEWKIPETGYDNVTSLALNRLSKAQVAKIVRAVAGSHIASSAVDRVVERTDGIPLFVEELTKSLVEGGLDIAEDEIPATLQASLLARLDRIGPAAKEVAQIGAVIGRAFSHYLISEVSDKANEDLATVLDALVVSELVFKTGNKKDAQYVFKHALVQDVAYSSMLQARRREIHGRIAKVIVSADPMQGEVRPELVAYHYQKSQQIDKALDWWQRAGELAATRSQNREAIAHYQAAVELARTLEDETRKRQVEMALQLKIGPLHVMTDGIASETMRAAFERAAELNDAESDAKTVYPIKWHLWYHFEQRTELEKSRVMAEDLVAYAERSNDSGMLIEANHAAWTTYASQGLMEDCLDRSCRAIEMFDRKTHDHLKYEMGGHDPLICGFLHARWALETRGFGDQADVYLEKSRRRFDELDHLPSRLIQSIGSIMMTGMVNDRVGLDERIEEARVLCESIGATAYIGITQVIEGWLQTMSKPDPAAIEKIETGIAQFKNTGARLRLPMYLSYLAEAALNCGKYDYGLQVCNEAIERSLQTQQQLYIPTARSIRGELLIASGASNAEVDAEFENAVQSARKMDLHWLELLSAKRYASYLGNEGRTDEAAALLRPICDWFTECQERPDLIEAKFMLSNYE